MVIVWFFLKLSPTFWGYSVVLGLNQAHSLDFPNHPTYKPTFLPILRESQLPKSVVVAVTRIFSFFLI